MIGKAALALLILAAPAGASAMTVAEFLAKADALQAKGVGALFSGDLKLLKTEVTSAGKALRAEQAAAVKAGRKPTACLPAKAATNSDELLAYFRAIPPAQREMSVKDGFAGLIRKKYPCPV